MKIFNFLELFFLISLAIMFILVGLLMYHIRTQINTAEKRTDTLYEIVTNLSNELNAQKVHMANLKYLISNNVTPTPLQPSPPIVKKIVVSDDENDSTDGEYDEDDDDEDDEDDEDNTITDIDYEQEKFDEDSTDIPVNTMDVGEIHVIKIPMYDEPEIVDLVVTEVPSSTPLEDIMPAAAAVEPEPAAAPVPVSDDNDSTTTEDIHKMSLTKLRKLATERGLYTTQDVSKIKKAELIAALEVASADPQ